MNKLRIGFLMTCALAGLAALPANVDAAQKIIPATICNPYNAGQANDIDYVQQGVRTTAAATRPVICAIPRELTVAGASVSVSGIVSGGATMPVTLYSYDSLNNFKGSATNTGMVGLFGFGLSLTTAQAPAGAILSMIATLPASSNGTLFDGFADH